MKYIAKPIEAFQFGVDETPDWFTSDYFKPYYGTSEHKGGYVWGGIILKDANPITRKRVAVEGDMIIKDIYYGIYPCKVGIFNEIYDQETK